MLLKFCMKRFKVLMGIIPSKVQTKCYSCFQ